MYLDELHDILIDWFDRLLCLAALAIIVAAVSYGASRLVPGLPASVEATVSRTYRVAASLSAASLKCGMSLAAAAVEGGQAAD